MFGIRFSRTAPTTHVMHFKNGKILREGAGLSFLYYAPTSTLVQIPIGTAEQPFVFTETTCDFQEVTLQGQISYRIADPKRLSKLLDYSVDGRGRYLTDDPEVLTQRLVHTAQTLAHDHVQGLDLRKALVSSEEIGGAIRTGLTAAPAVALLGVEIIGLSLLAIRPTPEMARALEAESREALQQKADGAIYERRNAAVEEERKIKENELNTDIAVEEKKRLIRERKIGADIAVEAKRALLIDRQVKNDRKAADAQAYALEAQIKPLRDLDWKMLTALATGGGDPKQMIALAFRELAENAGRIGELNMTPDLLRTLMTSPKKG